MVPVLNGLFQVMITEAAVSGNVKLVQALIEHKADLEQKDRTLHVREAHSLGLQLAFALTQTPLTAAIEANHLDVVKCLVQGKAQVNVAQPSGLVSES